MTSPLDTLASGVSKSIRHEQRRHRNNPHALPLPKQNSARDDYGWNAGLNEISAREIDQSFIGLEVAREAFIDGKIRERQLKDQTNDLIDRLTRVGIEGRTQTRDTAIIGLVTGQAETIQPFRNCNMLPAVQSKNVHEMLKSVRYLFDVTKKGRLRMLVVSAGWVPLEEYRKHHREHTRRMSKFAASKKLKALGIDVEFYNVEVTIHRNEDGQAMLNLHSHVLFKCRRYLGSKRWAEFLKFARGYFPKGYAHDSKIEKPAEVVKYVFKPQEFDLLTDDELGELFQQIAGGRPKFDPDTGEVEMRPDEHGDLVPVRERGLKFFHPLGSLRAFRKKLRENRQKLLLVPTADDRWIWRVTEPKDAEQRPEPSDSPPEVNRVLAITRPMPKFSQRMEPCLVVLNFNGDLDDVIKRNGLQDRAAEVRAMFYLRVDAERRGEAAPMKHTTTTTVIEWVEEMAQGPPPDARLSSPDTQIDPITEKQEPGRDPGTAEMRPGMSPGANPYPLPGHA